MSEDQRRLALEERGANGECKVIPAERVSKEAAYGALFFISTNIKGARTKKDTIRNISQKGDFSRRIEDIVYKFNELANKIRTENMDENTQQGVYHNIVILKGQLKTIIEEMDFILMPR